MSFKSVEWAMHMTPTKGRPGDKFVLVTLAWHKNEQTGKCCPSIPLLMSETGMSRDFIRDALKRLTAAGLIKVSRTPGGRTDYLLVGGSNDYRVPTTTGEQLLPGEGSNDYRGRGVTATPNMEVNKEFNKEGENPPPPSPPPARRKTAFPCPEGIKPEAWDASNRIRRNKRLGSWTEYAWNLAVKQAATKGLSPQQMLDVCIEHGWGSFRAEYYKPNGGRPGSQQRTSTSSLSDEERKKLGIGFDVDYSKLDYTDGAF